ncbi:MAG: hypothetical protein RJA07_2693 [Bacteroidota bacterium]|jgi:DNA polymerase-3 subunit gamma/tau
MQGLILVNGNIFTFASLIKNKMEAFVVSARKYRPARFEDVVGQSHITTTLKNALRQQQLAHAFLFCGPRGVGKTTNARILAKVINCENLTADVEPCNECRSCQSFNSNSSFNIFELDAASNNSVDDIRELVQQVRIPPQGSKYKVYIIDEVHMLSSQAFNAFLKTLEEPPPYAIFILATTEKQKIIPTILSRCQVFDFNRIKMDDMVAHLKKIAIDRNVSASDEALHLIALKADGGLRDALSLFDKMASFCSGNIQINDVLEQLNILDYEFNFKMADAMMVEDRVTVLHTFHQILQKGFEGDNVINALADHFRNLLMCKDAATVNLLEVTESLREKYASQAKQTPLAFLLSALNILNDCDLHYRSSKNRRLHVEMCLIKLCYLNRVLLQPTQIVNIPNTESDSKKKTEPIAGIEAPKVAQPIVAQQPVPLQNNNPIAAEPTPQYIPKTALKATGSSASDTSGINLKGFDLSKMQQQMPKQNVVEKPIEVINEILPKIEQEITLQKSPEKKLYTPMEKFNAMVEKNPALKILANELKMEVDF